MRAKLLKLFLAIAVFASFTLPSVAQFPEENAILVIANAGRVLDEAGTALGNRETPLADRLGKASNLFRDLTVDVSAEPPLTLLSLSMARSLAGIAREMAAGNREQVTAHLVEYRAALNRFALGVAKEVAIAQRTDPERAAELRLPEVSEALLTSLHALDGLINDELPQLADDDLEESLGVALIGIGSHWRRASAGLKLWGASAPRFSTWTGGCRCGAREGSWVCVVEEGVFCDTCEWANTDPGPNG